MNRSDIFNRRLFLQSATGAALSMTHAIANPTPATAAAVHPAFPTGQPSGRGPGDFDFLTGEWRILIRKFDTSGPDGMRTREASATVHRVLGGAGSIEELRNGDGSMWGMGVRVWHPETRQWADHWTAAQDGVVNPPQLGSFIGGAGLFMADDVDDGRPVKIRAVWDQITPNSCRWYQCMSKDDGATWEYDWFMAWTRA